MAANQVQMIQNLIQVIEENIRQELDLDLIAEKTGFSKFYVHRLFRALTGMSMMAYVRGRRLTLSLSDLINTRLNIIDIALRYHFSHEQSYIRAFKKQFHITPAQYRRSHGELPIVEKFDTAHLYGTEQGLLSAPHMCMIPEFYLQGIEREIIHDHNYYHYDTNQLVNKWEKTYLKQIKNKVDEFVYFGLVQYNQNPKGRLYAACTQVKALGKTHEPVKSYTIPTHNYVSFRYVGMHSPYEITFRTLLGLYENINAWKAETSYLQAGNFHIERVDLKKCSASYCEMDIYVPITSTPKTIDTFLHTGEDNGAKQKTEFHH